MRCEEVIQCLENLAPSWMAEGWDNVGLLLGREEQEIRKILLALDPSSQVIEQAVELGVDLLITHHPLIFSGLKSVTTKDFIGKRVYQLIRKDISYFVMHTNFDVRGMADAVAHQLSLNNVEVLEITVSQPCVKEGIGCIGDLPRQMGLRECAVYVKQCCGLDSVRWFGQEKQQIVKMALVPGSGKSFIRQAIEKGADVLLTGDIGHHDGLDAQEQGLAIIDAGHYGLEKIFSSYWEEVLKRELPGIEIYQAREEAPFQTD